MKSVGPNVGMRVREVMGKYVHVFRYCSLARTFVTVASALAFVLLLAMAPHLTGAELDVVAHSVAQGMDANAILKVVVAARKQSKTAPPKVWAIPRATQGTTHKRGGRNA